MQAYAMRGKIR